MGAPRENGRAVGVARLLVELVRDKIGPVASFMGFTVVIAVFWFGGQQVLNGTLTAGQLTMFLILTLTIAGSIGSFSGLWTSLQEALGATKRIFEILDTPSDIVDQPGAKALPRIEGNPPRITTWLNDEIMFQGTDTENHAINGATEGSIAIQLHGGERWRAGGFWRWRVIAVKELPDTAPRK